MKQFEKNEGRQAVAYLACAVVFWIRLDDFGASEFSGGTLTGKLFTITELGSLLFLVALLATIFFPRTAAAIALAATILGFPFYLYILMPGLFRRIFKGEYSAPGQGQFVWNTWAFVGMLTLAIATFFSLRTLSRRLKRPAG